MAIGKGSIGLSIALLLLGFVDPGSATPLVAISPDQIGLISSGTPPATGVANRIALDLGQPNFASIVHGEVSPTDLTFSLTVEIDSGSMIALEILAGPPTSIDENRRAVTAAGTVAGPGIVPTSTEAFGTSSIVFHFAPGIGAGAGSAVLFVSFESLLPGDFVLLAPVADLSQSVQKANGFLVVPEPHLAVLLVVGLAGLRCLTRRRSRPRTPCPTW